VKLATHQPMAKKKKKAAKKAARKKAAKKRVARFASRASVSENASATLTEEDLPADLSEIPPGAVQAADQVGAVPPESEARAEVVQTTQQVGQALPDVEAEATRPGGLGDIAATRDLVWLVGPARRPRSAIVGRALSDGRATNERRRMTNLRIAERIQAGGPHHLRAEVQQALAAYDQAPAAHARTLAGLFRSAISYLDAMGYVRAGVQAGVYLVGNGPVIFENWPDWGVADEEPPPLRRPRRLQAAPQVETPPAPPPIPPATGSMAIPNGTIRRRLMPLDTGRDNAPPAPTNGTDRSGGVDP